MARILIISTHGSEDPTRAGVAFVMAKGAVEAGHKPEILLAGDAAVLARKVVAESVLPVGLPPLKELAQFAIANGVPVYTWGLCGKARGVTDEDLGWLNSKWTTPKDAAQLSIDVDRVLTFWCLKASVGLVRTMQARVSTASLRVTWNNGDCCDVLSRGDMPTYEFLCKKCKKVFEVSCSITEYERKKKKGIECAKCGSSEVLQQVSGFQVQTSKKSWIRSESAPANMQSGARKIHNSPICTWNTICPLKGCYRC